MNQKQLFIIVGIVLLLVLAGAGFFYGIRQTYLYILNPVAPPVDTRPFPTSTPPAPINQIDINIYTDETGSRLVITWRDLPANTARIVIYRKGKPTRDHWEAWKAVNVGGTLNGAFSISLKKGEDANDFTYYTETVSTGGQTTWTSPAAPPVGPPPSDIEYSPTSTVSVTNPPPPPPAPTSTPSVTEPNPSSTATSSVPSTPTSTPPATTPSSTPGTPSTGQTTTIVYYTPQSTVSGYESPQSGSFWVRHVGQYIEIGWQNLTSSTDRLIIFRGPAEDGPWITLIDLDQPDIIGPRTIRLLDNTVHSTQYYKMETRASGTPMTTYGPLLLPPIESS